MPPHNGAGFPLELMNAIHFARVQTAPEVRHIRSPWSLQSGGHGLRASIKNGGAVGAIYQSLCMISKYSLPNVVLLNP